MNYTLSIIAVALVCLTTLVVGALGLRLSRRTSDFYVAGRTVSPRLNASAISGEYLSAASFLGVAGLIYDQGVDMLWLPVGYTLGYLVLLVVVAAPMRRSGAYTLPDFAEARLGSRAIRLVSSLLVVGIGWLYLVPQFQGASLTLTLVTGAPAWVGGLRGHGRRRGGRRRRRHAVDHLRAGRAVLDQAHRPGRAGVRAAGPVVPVGIAGAAGRPVVEHPAVPHRPRRPPHLPHGSTVLALCLGTMGLPHVLVRYYTNPDGIGARRTTVTVIALLGIFYLFPPIYARLGRVAYPTLAAGRALRHASCCGCPRPCSPGWAGSCSRRCSRGARSRRSCPRHPVWPCRSPGSSTRSCCGPGSPGSRAVTCPASVGSGSPRSSRSSSRTPSAGRPSHWAWPPPVGLAFAVAAATFAPLIMLGVWWRRLSTWGAMAGLVTGALSAGLAIGWTIASGPEGGWTGALLANPAMWATPLAIATRCSSRWPRRRGSPPERPARWCGCTRPERVALARSRIRD